ncbi:MAG: hypothetical protein JNG88_18090, partial [Phycisphaerales bacterium]|nr:hypothetical protein [Phycisphaerales bacterium]
FYYAGWRVVELCDKATPAATLGQFVYGTQYIDEAVVYDRNTDVNSDNDCVDSGGSQRYVYHQDVNYRVMSLTREDGSAVERYEYSAYGEPVVLRGVPSGGSSESGAATYASTVGNPLMHQGLWRDGESKSYQNRYRTLNSVVGRFLQRDPLGYADGMNAFEYQLTNPLWYSDAPGLAPDDRHVMNRDQFRERLREFRKAHPHLSNRQLLLLLSQFMLNADYTLYGKRYVWIEGLGWIDLLHVFRTAYYEDMTGLGYWLGWLMEVKQQITGDPSGAPMGGNEDMTSNAVGAWLANQEDDGALIFEDWLIDVIENGPGQVSNSPPAVGDSGSSSSCSSSDYAKRNLNIPGAVNGPSCFTGETRVTLPNGTFKPISELCVGDSILVCDEQTLTNREGTVQRIRTATADRLLKIEYSGYIIYCTEDHPFMLKSHEWRTAGNLKVGDSLMTAVDEITIERITTTIGRFEVWNITVGPVHAFYVSEGGVIVHNKMLQ